MLEHTLGDTEQGPVGDFDDRIDITSNIGQKQLPYLHRCVSKSEPA